MRETIMAKPFKQLRDKMSPKAQKTAAKKARRMLRKINGDRYTDDRGVLNFQKADTSRYFPIFSYHNVSPSLCAFKYLKNLNIISQVAVTIFTPSLSVLFSMRPCLIESA